MRMTVALILIVLCIFIICVVSAPQKHALTNECKYNNLEPGTYRCILPDDQISFYVDCMVDGTMYINPGQQSLYHYHKQSGLEMKFVLIISSNYESENDVDIEHLPKLRDLIINDDSNTNTNENENIDLNDASGSNDNSDNSNNDDSTLNEDSLESEELTESEKESVNLTAQYIVYGVIIVMALIFALGICLLIYWWCCHNKSKTTIGNNISDETQPFIDIRSANTIKKQQTNGINGSVIYLQREENSNHSLNNNIYHDIINGVNDNEDGDDLIAHYGATTIANNNQNHGYIIAKYPK